MILLDNRYKGFKITCIMFADQPHHLKGYDRLVFTMCMKEDNEIKADGFTAYPFWHTIVNLDNSYTEDYKLDGFGFDGNTRANIHRAVRAGMTYKINEDWDNYIILQNNFIKAKKLWLKPYEKEFLQQFKGFLINIYDSQGTMLEAGYFVIMGDKLWTLSICSYRLIDKSYERLCSHASRFLYYQAMKYGKEQGCKTLWFNVGKDLDHPDSVSKFKLGFGGKRIQKNTYVKDLNPLLKVAGRFGIGRFD